MVIFVVVLVTKIALPRVSQMFSAREKLSLTQIYASASGSHHRCLYASFSVKNSP